MSSARLLADRRRLVRAAEVIKTYADKRVAHWDRKAPRRILTVKDVDGCIEVIEKLTSKYAILVLREGGPLMPTFTYDWKKPFREPWIREAAQAASQRALVD